MNEIVIIGAEDAVEGPSRTSPLDRWYATVVAVHAQAKTVRIFQFVSADEDAPTSLYYSTVIRERFSLR